jgi:hypothetical protein
MADISDVKEGEIKDLYVSLEGLQCKSPQGTASTQLLTAVTAGIRTRVLY